MKLSMKVYRARQERGAASIFVVAFFTLLIGVITLSFVNIVIQDQKQAINNDLSQSAYDSAMAGTEDAQRALKWYTNECTVEKVKARADSGVPEQVSLNGECAHFESGGACNIQKISSTNVPQILPGVKAGSNGKEVKISQSSDESDEKLDQAYTCATLKTRTEDYKASLIDGKSDTLIPLRVVNNTAISSIELNWFNVGGNSANVAPDALSLPSQSPTSTSKKPLKVPTGSTMSGYDKWGNATPPILRAEIIPVSRKDPTSATPLDAQAAPVDVNNINEQTRTVFLYPSRDASAPDTVSLNAADPGGRGRQTKTDAPKVVKCNPSAVDGQYACSITINNLLPGNPVEPVGMTRNTDYFLRVTPIYNNTNIQIKVRGSGGQVLVFDNVAPEIDSTGRASDVYRRVQTRVQTIMGANPTSDGGFDITQGLCKDFQVPEYKTNCSPDLMPN